MHSLYCVCYNIYHSMYDWILKAEKNSLSNKIYIRVFSCSGAAV